MIKLKSLILKEYKEGDPVRFSDECIGNHHGQSDFILRALDDKDNILGFIKYSSYQDIPYVNLIQTNKAFTRKGVATLLAKKLQKKYPNEEINWGMTTSDGTRFLTALPRYFVKNEEYAKLIKKYKALKQFDLNYRILQKTWENLTTQDPKRADELKPKVVSLGDKWNRVHDAMYDIEEKLRDMTPGKWMVKI